MPPKGHSGSSHSFSGSSFRSSSSHRSSSSFGFGSGPSRRSTSSHNDSQRRSVSSGGGLLDPFGRSSRRTQPGPFVAGSSRPIIYRGRNRSFNYFPFLWYDLNHNRHEPGYYDMETGEKVNEESVEKDGKFETLYKCSYCGTETKVVWESGQKPVCPACGAPLEMKPQEETQSGVQNPSTGKKVLNKKTGIGCFGIILLIYVFLMLRSCVGSIFPKPQTVSYPSEYSDAVLPAPETVDNYEYTPEESIYVDALERYCYWNDEYDSYYDKRTDCYFVYNQDLSVPVWQYWFEGISSDYGDYGWMEYDQKTDKWYIEAGDGNWIVLPDRYDPSDLWHF